MNGVWIEICSPYFNKLRNEMLNLMPMNEYGEIERSRSSSSIHISTRTGTKDNGGVTDSFSSQIRRRFLEGKKSIISLVISLA